MPETKDSNRLLLVVMVAVIAALVVAVLALVLVISSDGDDDEPAAGRDDRDAAPSVLVIADASRGDCADVADEADESVVLVPQDCDEDHDAEITWTGTYGDVENVDFVPTSPDDLTDEAISEAVCTGLMDDADVDAVGDDVVYQLVNEDSSPTRDEAALCYARPTGGESYTDRQLS